jgi:hypothetical protein
MMIYGTTPPEVLATRVSENVEDGIEGKNEPAMAPAREESNDASARTSHILIFLSTPQLKTLWSSAQQTPDIFP